MRRCAETARVFVVNKVTVEVCIHYGLFGVPDTARAANQIHMVNPGEKLFLYVHGVKELYGVYRAIGRAFRETEPEKGPWKGREEDRKRGFYPFRIEVEPIHAYREPLRLGDVESLGVELNEDVFRARPSVVYIQDASAEKLELELDKRNQNVPFAPACEVKYPSKPTEFALDSSKGSEEEKLTFLIQTAMDSIESGLQPIQAFYPLRAATGRNVWIDILARDQLKTYVVVELKTGELQESIWNQVFHYAWILRSRLIPGTKVRSIVVCKTAEPKLALAYSEMKEQLRDPGFVKVYKYYRSANELQFKELSP
jgi:hypothetical protein